MARTVVRARVVAIGLSVSLGTVPARAQQFSQAPLGDVARQAEKARATVRKATRTYTNADLGAVTDAAETVSGSPSASGVPTKTASAEPKSQSAEPGTKSEAATPVEKTPIGNAAMPEEYWRQRATFIRSEAERARELLDAARKNPVHSPEDQARNDAAAARVQDMINGLKKQWAQLEAAITTAKLPQLWIAPPPNFP